MKRELKTNLEKFMDKVLKELIIWGHQHHEIDAAYKAAMHEARLRRQREINGSVPIRRKK